jgi:hypothetical protein
MDEDDCTEYVVEVADAEPLHVADVAIIAFDLVSDWHHDLAEAFSRLARAIAADANYRIEKRRFYDAITADIETITKES